MHSSTACQSALESPQKVAAHHAVDHHQSLAPAKVYFWVAWACGLAWWHAPTNLEMASSATVLLAIIAVGVAVSAGGNLSAARRHDSAVIRAAVPTVAQQISSRFRKNSSLSISFVLPVAVFLAGAGARDAIGFLPKGGRTDKRPKPICSGRHIKFPAAAAMAAAAVFAGETAKRLLAMKAVKTSRSGGHNAPEEDASSEWAAVALALVTAVALCITALAISISVVRTRGDRQRQLRHGIRYPHPLMAPSVDRALAVAVSRQHVIDF